MEKKYIIGKKNLRRDANNKKKLLKEIIDSEGTKLALKIKEVERVNCALVLISTLFMMIIVALMVDKFFWGWM